MTTLTEGQHRGEFLVSCANGTRSCEQVTIKSGEDLQAGHILGKITLGAASSAAGGGNTGNGAMGAVTVGASAQVGAYTLRIIEAAANAGDFELIDPQGDVVGVGTVAVAFSGGGLSFTLADGATDFAVGDNFTITVAAGSGKYVEWDPTNTDGSQIVAGISHDNVDATGGDTQATICARDCEVNGSELVYFSGADASNKAAAKTQLAALGIIVR